MAILSPSLPGNVLTNQAISNTRQAQAQQEPVRPTAERSPEPQSVLVPGISREIMVKIASTAEEWEQAFALVADNYQDKGYEAATNKPYRFTPYHALPDTVVFVAKLEGRVVATFSLVADNPHLGLPMEAIFDQEIADLRRQGRRMAEVTSFAAVDLGQREFLQVFTMMIRLMKQYHVSRGGDTWVITVNPRHRNFYCKVLGYQALGSSKPYAAVGDAPAEAYVLDRDTMRANAPRSYEFVFGKWLPQAALTGVSLPRPFVRYFWSESNQAEPGRISSILRDVVTASGRHAG